MFGSCDSQHISYNSECCTRKIHRLLSLHEGSSLTVHHRRHSTSEDDRFATSYTIAPIEIVTDLGIVCVVAIELDCTTDGYAIESCVVP